MKRMINFSQAKLKRDEQLRFLTYIEQSLANGVSLSSCFGLMPSIWPEKAKLFMRLHVQMKAGLKLGAAFSFLGFGATTVTQIELALREGRLADCLKQLTTLIRLKNEQIKKLKAELSYPAVLAVMMLILLVFMQSFISDQFAASGEHTGDIMITALVLFSLALLYLFVRVLFLLNRQDFAALTKLSRYPIIGKVVTNYAQYLLVYDLWLLVSSGFSLQKICSLALKQDTRSLQYRLGRRCSEALSQGQAVKQIIAREKFLPDSLLLLLDTGNDRQKLSQNLFLLGRTYFISLNAQIEKLVVNVQPLCFILIGLCIIGMYLKLLLPMYAMMQTM